MLYRLEDEPSSRLFLSLAIGCKNETIYVMLDMHCAPAGQTGDNIDDSYGYPFLFESEEAQALTTAKFGPRKPWRMEICPAAISRIILGIKNGLNLGVPSPFAKFVTSSWNVIRPPMPLANTTPTLFVLTFSFEIPASATAWS